MKHQRLTPVALICGLVLFAVQAGAQGILYKASGSVVAAKTGKGQTETGASEATLQRRDIFVLGSVHYGREDMYPLPEILERILQQARVMLVEIDILDADMNQVGRLMAAHGYYPPGDSLQRRLQPEQWLRLTGLLGRIGLQDRLVARMRPWMAAISMVDVLAREQGLSAKLGIDLYLLKRARSSGMPVIALESFETQLKIFWEMDPHEQLEYLLSELDSVEENSKSLVDLIRMWKQSDAKGIDGLLRRGIKDRGFESLYNRLIVQRNESLLQAVLLNAREHQSMLVVVGVGHLVGRTGLAEGLRKAGFNIEKLH